MQSQAQERQRIDVGTTHGAFDFLKFLANEKPLNGLDSAHRIAALDEVARALNEGQRLEAADAARKEFEAAALAEPPDKAVEEATDSTTGDFEPDRDFTEEASENAVET